MSTQLWPGHRVLGCNPGRYGQLFGMVDDETAAGALKACVCVCACVRVRVCECARACVRVYLRVRTCAGTWGLARVIIMLVSPATLKHSHFQQSATGGAAPSP